MICVEQKEDEVFIACDKVGAKKLSDVLNEFIEREVRDHEHLTQFDGLSMEQISSGPGFSVVPVLHIYYRP